MGSFSVAQPSQDDDYNTVRFMKKHGVENVDSLVERSVREPEWFWPALESEFGFMWEVPPTSYSAPSEFGGEWFPGGRLNAIKSVLMQHLGRDGSARTALRWIGEPGEVIELSFTALAAHVQSVINALTARGIGKGSKVGIFLPNLPEAYITMLACTHVGAVFCPVFSGYGDESIIQRFAQFQPELIVTGDTFWRAGKQRPLKATIDRIRPELPLYPSVMMVRRTGAKVDWDAERDFLYPSAPEPIIELTAPTIVEADHPLAVLYTSGSTGMPKGTVHTHASYVLKCVNDYYFCMDVKPSDTVFWLGDPGWAAGPHLMYAGLSLGAEVVFYEGSPDYPEVGRLWADIAESGVTVLGLSPTVFRQARSNGLLPAEDHDLSRLRIIGSAGEAWDELTWRWSMENVGANHCPIINWSGGTEVAGGILGCYPHLPLSPTAFHGPVPGMAPRVVSDAGIAVRGEVGELVLTEPAVGMTRSFWKNDEAFKEAYLTERPGLWSHGDLAITRTDGSWLVVGRSDDTLKVSGRRVGPAEVEAVVNSHPAIGGVCCSRYTGREKGNTLMRIRRTACHSNGNSKPWK